VRVAIYARKSPHDHPKRDSVDRQVAHSRDYAARRGWTVADEHVYIDDNISSICGRGL
jgi:DNA invertase Pin-like site-specific DNA recombinase